MTNKYPLTVKEARAALVNEPVGTIVEDINLDQWRRRVAPGGADEDLWSIEFRIEDARSWRDTDIGPYEVANYRIIPLGSEEHPDYQAPQPKLLSAEAALALEEFYIVCKYLPDGFYAFTEDIASIGNLARLANVLFLTYEAEHQGWPIVATREEAEQLIKKGQ